MRLETGFNMKPLLLKYTSTYHYGISLL